MAINDSASYEVRFNLVLGVLEYAKNGGWVAVPVAPLSITAGSISSGAATVGQVLTANGTGGVTFV